MTRVSRLTGFLFLAATLLFLAAATILSATFDWPDILREPPDVVLPAFVAGGTSLVWTWFAVAWTYAILAVPILLLPAALGRQSGLALKVATYAGAASVLLSLIGFLRWVFVVPPLAAAYVGGDEAAGSAWMAQHQYGGALLGEHLGQLLAIAWSVTVSIVIVRTRVLPAWSGWLGLLASAVYFTSQADIMSTAIPTFPVWELGGLLGSYLWAAWLLVLGVMLLIRRRSPA